MMCLVCHELIDDLHWRFGLGAISAVYKTRNQNIRGCCYVGATSLATRERERENYHTREKE